MKTARLVSLVLTLSGLTLASAQAPVTGNARRSSAARSATPVVRVLDANLDGVISLGEIRDAAASLRLLDTDADGTLSFAELHPGRAGDAAAPDMTDGRTSRIDPVLRALDLDENDELSPYEILAAKGRLLALDANDDGRLAGDETRTIPAE